MAWPYEFINLSTEDKHLRRLALDRYAGYAQLSALLPVALLLLFRATSWAIQQAKQQRGSYDAIPNSPSLKSRRLSTAGTWTTHGRQLWWWLDDDVMLFGQVWGQRDQWIVGALWGIWLTLLCVLGTGSDYMHLTKRFGIIGVSQFPIQYLLALKSLNPFAFVFRTSHERVNRWHRVLGRLTYALLSMHALLYLNFFFQMGTLGEKLTSSKTVILGVICFVAFSLLNTTALRMVRSLSYRLFFITHLLVVLVGPPLVIFHTRRSTVFMAEAILAFIADLVSRKLDTVTSQATLESIPGTSLVKISATVPYSKLNRFREHPGSHIYLNLPAAARPSANPASSSFLVFEFLHNPFTVASVDEQNNGLTLVARHLSGPMTTALARLAQAGKHIGGGDSDAVYDESRIPINLEGPYGVRSLFPQLTSGEYDRVLLVAGGVGATFTVPIYRSLLQDNPNAKVEMVWAVRGAGDATWAVSGADAKGIMDDENVHIFLTGDIIEWGTGLPTSNASGHAQSSNAGNATDAEVEMTPMYRDRKRNRYTSQHNRKRPDLQKIVDNVFRHGAEERIAVLVCGPTPMARELREHVSVWVMKGRTVWWHNEGFGW
ncbi:ferric reductase like transmembrane component [Thozetella sp. PMI_491]|nr:ferric reductase like transmembrane component [Thozetella sp. PMI_491]